MHALSSLPRNPHIMTSERAGIAIQGRGNRKNSDRAWTSLVQPLLHLDFPFEHYHHSVPMG